MNHRLGAGAPVCWAVAALVFAPAVVSQAAWGLRGSYAKFGVVAVGLVLVALAGLLFSACLRLGMRSSRSSARRRQVRALVVGTSSVGAVALAFVPLALALRGAGLALPDIRYKFATFEQFVYAVALNPATGVALLVLLPVAVVWAYRLQVLGEPTESPRHANAA